MTDEYQVTGVLDADTAAALSIGDDQILVEHDDPDERLLAEPKENGGEEA